MNILMQEISSIYYIIDTSGQIQYLSSSIERIVGVKAEVFVGKPFIEFIHPEDLQNVIDNFKDAIVGNGKYHEYRVVLPNKQIVYISSQGHLLYDDHGQQLGIHGFMNDRTNEVIKQQELDQQRLFYKSLVDTSPYPVYICDEKSIIFVNSAFEELYEYSLDELSSPDFSFFNLISPEQHQMVVQLLELCKTGVKTKENFYFTGVSKSGKRMYLYTAMSVVIINDKLHFQGITRNITREIISEETLFNSKQMLRFVFDNIPQRIYLKDKDLVYFSANKQFLKDVNCEIEQEIIGLTDNDLPWKDYSEELIEEDLRVIQGEIVHSESAKYLIDGKLFIRRKTKVPLKNIKGEIIGILGTYEDITNMHYFNEAIINSEKKYRSIFNNPHTPMFIIEPETGNILEANSAASDFYEYNVEEIKSICQFDNSPLPEILKQMSEAKNNSRNIFFMKHKKKSGDVFDVEVHSGPIILDNKEYLIAIIFDITEKSVIIDELKVAKKQAEEMNRLKSVFLANMSHELRTPLVGILGYSQIIRDEAADESISKMGENIHKGGNRLLQTLNLILDLSRIEANRMETTYIKSNVSEILNDVYCNFQSAAKLKNLEFSCTMQDEPVFITTDEMHLTSILNNLINNAIKFTEKGSVVLSLATENDKAVFKVSDTGIGIPPEKQFLVFDAFRQASEGISRRFEGTGLGLTLTRKFVKLLGGEIDMKSELGVGTTFTIIFPLSRDLVMINEIEETESNIPLLKEILVVEDDAQNYEITSLFLKDIYSCTHASSGEQALHYIQNKKFDLILMDINLGTGLSGIDVLHKLKEVPEKKDTPVIAVTAFAMKHDIAEFLKKGFDQVLTKPFTKSMLNYTIQKYIN